MNILALSGSMRQASTNTAMLNAMRETAPQGMNIQVFTGLDNLPIFSPDLEGDATPPNVTAFKDRINWADGLIIACPEYVRTLPGGVKNAIDWLVSGQEIIHKPIAIAHASHRGDDMLATLQVVLETISSQFCPTPFIRFPLMKMTPAAVNAFLKAPQNTKNIHSFLLDFQTHIKKTPATQKSQTE